MTEHAPAPKTPLQDRPLAPRGRKPALRPRTGSPDLQAPTLPSPSSVPAKERLEPWDRGARETDREWALFLAYRDSAYPEGYAGAYIARNIESTARSVGLSEAYLRNISCSYAWAWRCAHYDRWVDQQKNEARKTSLQVMRDQHRRLFGQVQELVSSELAKYVERSNSDRNMPVLKPSELVSLAEFATKQQRLLEGEATERTEVHHGGLVVDMSKLSLDELLALQKAREMGVEILPAEGEPVAYGHVESHATETEQEGTSEIPEDTLSELDETDTL